MTHDLVIVGGGPAGVAAGIYAARKKIKMVLVTDLFGGQSIVSDEIRNWIGEKSISGFDLAKKLEAHLRAQEGVEIKDGTRVKSIKKITGGFEIFTDNSETMSSRTVLIVAGSRHRRLEVPGEKEFEGKGVVFCSTCDAPLFRDKIVAVIGGGNAGLEAVADILPYARKIYLLEYGTVLRGDPVTQEKIFKNPKVEIIFNAATEMILGDKNVSGLKYRDNKTNSLKELRLDGIFVEIGIVPNGDLVKGLVEINSFGEIVVDHKTQATSCEGIWAAGDVSDALYKQNNISAGDGIKAVLNIYDYLNKPR